MKGVAIVSGGMDSVTMAYFLTRIKNHDLHLITFDYGQKHSKEIHYARKCAEALDFPHAVVKMPIFGKGSALTDGKVDVPEGHYAAPNMAATVVPNRNAIFLSLAYSLAISEGYDFVAAGMHAGDHPIYPDCRPEFTRAFEEMERLATEGYSVEGGVKFLAPFVEMGKHDIVFLGASIDVPFKDTWSCYQGNSVHCGRCGTCVERKEAFMLAEVEDPTVYDKFPDVRGI